MVHNFFVQEKAVAGIEMAFTIPVFIMLSMAILEYAVIFSVRSGLEEITREISRVKQSTNGNNDTAITNNLHTRITDIVFDPQNVTVDTYVQTPTGVSAEWRSLFGLHVNLVEPGVIPTSSVTFNANRAVRPAPLNLGTSLSFVAIRVTYRHEYFTPMAAIAGLGNDITMNTFSAFQKENDDI